MRIRTIKPEFWSDKRVGDWDPFTRLLFIGLWSLADDHGRGTAESAIIAAQLFPYDISRNPRETLARVSKSLATLSKDRRIAIYESGGQSFFEIINWQRHQRVDKPGKSRIPKQNGTFETLSRESREDSPEASRSDLGPRTIGPRTDIGGKPPITPAPVAQERGPWEVALGLDLPEPLRTEACLDWVRKWVAHRREIRKPVKPTMLQTQLDRWAQLHPPEKLAQLIEANIANGYQGVHELGGGQKNGAAGGKVGPGSMTTENAAGTTAQAVVRVVGKD